MDKLNVLVVGAGIGGLTAALCLARRGHAVQILEQSAEVTTTGAGIQLSPNCTRVLHSLGLAGELAAAACMPDAIEIRYWRDARLIASAPLGHGITAKFGSPYYHIHRADLAQLLFEEVSKCCGIHCSATVDRVLDDGREVSALIGSTTYKADLLIGADGIHSTVKNTCLSDEKPRFTGNIAWRATVPASQFASLTSTTQLWWGPGKHIVYYPISRGELINCVCIVEKSGWQRESWTEKGELSELQADFSGWHESITALLASVNSESCFKWALFDRDPLPRWCTGRVSLLGDACHPTLPFMAQGAAMAIEDAAVLAACLGDRSDIAASLMRYQNLRMARTKRIQRVSRRNAYVFHMSGMVSAVRNVLAGRMLADTMDWLYGYDALRSN
ncbi:MAG: FAD-dependent monooxygenase [Pseudomonadales bacterium]|nr:FAD-dependent monooxygenase [Pseudomonadales bacterium]